MYQAHLDDVFAQSSDEDKQFFVNARVSGGEHDSEGMTGLTMVNNGGEVSGSNVERHSKFVSCDAFHFVRGP